MKKYVLFILWFLIFKTFIAQQTISDFQDTKLWFKVKDDFVLNKISLMKNEEISETQRSWLEIGTLNKSFNKAEIKSLKVINRNTKSPKLLRIYELELNDAQLASKYLRQLGQEVNIEYVERVPLMKKHYVPNDPYYGPGNQWFLYKINAEQAWTAGQGNANVVVAIVDDAVDIDHPDLIPVLWTNSGEIANNGQDDDNNGYVDDIHGADVVYTNGNPRPGSPASYFDHGTHVAGCAAAATDNGLGVASIGFGVSIMSLKCSDNSSSMTNTYDGVLYAIENGADVINMSFGSNYYSNSYQNLLDWGHQNGVTLIASAGNDGNNTPQYPAAYNHVISVAATNGNDSKASFSNYDNGTGWVDLAAPGTSIYSTVPTSLGSYDYKQGTSMSGPIVAGLAGLMLSLNPGLTPSDIESCLKNNCDPATGTYASSLGAGRIDAGASMNCVASTLSWAPQAEFTSNVTTIAAGGSVNFTDMSVYNPNSWSWNFSGANPSSSSQQNPSNIVFNTPGTYNVSLTCSNANGSDTETKSAYITVNATTGCDTSTHVYSSDTIYTRIMGSGNNYLGGTNTNGMTAFCDYFQNVFASGTHIQDIIFFFTEGQTSQPGNTVDISIWNDNNGQPGSLAYTQSLSMQEIEDNNTVPNNPNSFYPTVVRLNTPYQITGDFYVGIEVSGSDPPNEKAAIAYTHNFNNDNSGRPGYSWLYASSGNAYSLPAGWYELSAIFQGAPKYAMHTYLRTTTTPVTASFTTNLQNICEGEQVQFDASSSTNASTFEWYIDGASPYYSTQSSTTVTFGNSGAYEATLLAFNSCGFYNIDVQNMNIDATPSVSVVSSDPTLCQGENSTLTASGASSYSWSPSGSLSSSSGSTVTATPSSSTTYTVVGSQGDCSSTATTSISVIEAPVADFNYTPDDGICKNQPIYFDGAVLSSNASAYDWSFIGADITSSSSSVEVVRYANQGSYDVELSIDNGCGQTDQITKSITVEDCDYLSIVETNKDLIKVVYSEQGVRVKLGNNDNAVIKIYNAIGQMLGVYELTGQEYLDLDILDRGTYFLNVCSENYLISKAIIVL